ncbi:MAG: class I SAM-dependent methyltransferase [Candidatus Omnitrophota bacterium]|nr:class I SAM-dependent methyltransferase [Candidatus Omnitrophota bacterium]
MLDDLRPGGSGILPEETPPKFFARHLSAYHFAFPYVEGKDVLEIGFGDGYGANFLAGRARSVKAVDVLDRNVELASKKYKRHNLEFRKSFGSYLDFSGDMFDVVVSFQVIEHVPENEIQAYLASIKRVLKKGGIVFISTLNLDKNKKTNRPYTKNPFHVKEFTFSDLSAAIKTVFNNYEIAGLFYTKKLRIFERLKKIGIFRYLPGPLNIVDKYYKNITVNDFIWQRKNLPKCVDFMVICKKI